MLRRKSKPSEPAQPTREEFNTLATGLSRRIEDFEKWLRDGELCCRCGVESEASPTTIIKEVSFSRLTRSGNVDWRLHVRYRDESNDQQETLLVDAPVYIKALAVEFFEPLVNKMKQTKLATVDGVRAALGSFDRFATKELGWKVPEKDNLE